MDGACDEMAEDTVSPTTPCEDPSSDATDCDATALVIATTLLAAEVIDTSNSDDGLGRMPSKELTETPARRVTELEREPAAAGPFALDVETTTGEDDGSEGRVMDVNREAAAIPVEGPGRTTLEGVWRMLAADDGMVVVWNCGPDADDDTRTSTTSDDDTTTLTISDDKTT